MSRKMIDYQVEGNKISTIDGYKVGEELHFKNIYICTTTPYSANSEKNVQGLNDGTWFTIQSGAIELTNILTSEEKEIIRKKACIRLDYLFANPKCSIKKYTEVFSDVPLSCLKFTSKKISKFRELFFKIVDHKLYLFANIYLFFYSIFRFFKRGV